MPLVLIAALFLLLCAFWVYQFVQLMLLSDSDFPSRYDKVLWVAVFVFVGALAPFAFLLWKRAYLEVRFSEMDETNRRR